jgi:CheY-like chemotaxis protein
LKRDARGAKIVRATRGALAPLVAFSRFRTTSMKKRILLLDDEMDFASVMKMTLELTGQYEVRTAVRSTTVLQVAHDFKPDLILLDCMMPVMDGGEVAAQIQADAELKDTPFMFLTAPPTRSSSAPAGATRGADVTCRRRWTWMIC